jgi:outer membrane protein assembly factor BamD (BamD/ComL family)
MAESALIHITSQMESDKTNTLTEAEELKRKGNEEFGKGNYVEAKQYYTKAIGNCLVDVSRVKSK